MKNTKQIIGSILITLSVVFSSFTVVAEVAVIVNPNNASAISEKDIKRIYLGKKKKFANGSSVIPVNLSAGDSTREAFESNVVGKSASKMKAYWAKLVFSGKGNPPKEAANAAEVLSLVAENPAVIGYIDASKVTDAVKVVGTF